VNKKRGGLSANHQVLHLIAPPPYTKGFTTPFFRLFYFRLTYSKSQPSDFGKVFLWKDPSLEDKVKAIAERYLKVENQSGSLC